MTETLSLKTDHRYWFLPVLLVFLLCRVERIDAEELQDKFGYKLAVIHTQALQPPGVAVHPTPSRDVITKFLTLLEILKARCTNSETEIADTIVATWKLMQKKGYSLTLLQTAQELANTALNQVLFGDEKVDFKTTTAFWISQTPVGQSQ